jgi:hypothetical protein
VRIAGQYGGTIDDVRLSNNGETLTLVDPAGAVIQSFRYDDNWHAATDGQGASLAVVDERADRANWELATGWRASLAGGGSPGDLDLLSGDFDADHRVGAHDLAALQAHLGLSAGASRTDGDFNRDGGVNRLDVALFVGHFGNEFTAPSPSPDVAAAAAPSASAVRAIVAPRRSARVIDAALAEENFGPRIAARRIAAPDAVGLEDSNHSTTVSATRISKRRP